MASVYFSKIYHQPLEFFLWLELGRFGIFKHTIIYTCIHYMYNNHACCACEGHTGTGGSMQNLQELTCNLDTILKESLYSV